jgi:hypothetical protein
MKSLQEFKEPILEEESDYAKFDMLVRAGLTNKAQIQRIHKILDKMKEDRPVFNNADRMILQNLFNKMVDLISNNKQIFQQTRRAVREELEEGVQDTSDYKIILTPEGGKRKVKAHRIVMAKDAPDVEDINGYLKKEEVIEAESLDENKKDTDEDPPFVLMLKRKAIRMYPNNTKIALYYNQKLDKYFSVPYGPSVSSPLQAEEKYYEQDDGPLSEAVMDQLHKIVNDKQANSVKFGNGKTRKIDHFTASAIVQLHKAVNDENKKKLADMVHKSPEHLAKAASFAFSKAK